jgi:glycerophosphoryl diester phosphodiesterase
MKIIGHRGARGLAPENTLASINKAIEYHVDAIEIDLRVTKDKQVVLHHDKALKQPNGEKSNLSELTLRELKEHKPDIVTLSEVIKIAGNNQVFILEIKSFLDCKEIIKEIKKITSSKFSSDNLLIGSKSQLALEFMHHELPAVKKVVIERWSGVRARRRAKKVGTNIIFMNYHFIWYGYIKSAKLSHLELYPYALNNPKKAMRWFKYGIAGVITDYPDLYEID